MSHETGMLLLGFALGLVGSAAVTVLYAYIVSPSLNVLAVPNEALGMENSGGKTRLYHLSVKNQHVPLFSFLVTTQPAWSCRAKLDLLDTEGRLVIGNINARWTSKPEPRARTGPGGMLLFDWSLVPQGRLCDVHEHYPELLVVAIKEEGESDCYLFSNESYRDTTWRLKKPDWRVPKGEYRLRVTLLYQRKPVCEEFRVSNNGPSLDDLRIERVS